MSHEGQSSHLPEWAIEILQKVFFLGLLASVALFGYLMYGLLSGQLANAAGAGKSDLQHGIALVTQLSFYLNIALIVTLAAGVALFYDNEGAAILMVLIAAFLAYGLQFLLDYFGSDASQITSGPLSSMTLGEIRNAGLIIAVPGVVLFLRNLVMRIADVRRGPDLLAMQYGQGVRKEDDSPRALVGAFAKCWQLPYCREGIRVKCPIYHARTKCWKERVGCMCEENIIRLAAGGTEQKSVDMSKEGGFVPVGDLIARSETTMRSHLPTRPGPRGVRIPTNPHLSEHQKRERCRNCIIYNEHQRQKYQLLSPIVTIAVPLIIFLRFDDMRTWLGQLLQSADVLIGHLQFAHHAATGPSALSVEFNDSLFVEGFLVVCVGLMIMTWALRLLEYCTFKIKI